MRIAVASDHAGFHLKEALCSHLSGEHEVVDLGPRSAARCDYPDFADAVARAVAGHEADLGVLVCGSGTGMSIAANKVAGVRAATVTDVEHATLAREHNHVNVLCLGARFTAVPYAEQIVDAWLQATPGEGRHADRVAKISALEHAD